MQWEAARHVLEESKIFGRRLGAVKVKHLMSP